MERLPARGFYTKLLQLKKRNPALANGDSCAVFEALAVSSSPGVYGFVRRQQQVVLALVNFDRQPGILTLHGLGPGTYQDIFSGQV